ncbi:hypothetical protein [Desulfoferrobacter suflitae]|uniref:hypothetical protein n=1 Tax=Desulfoferrobacter suflitae TaxID=2865782 RepID=UPI002164DE16|nr:hypothetical protein [Desulfoferrobacter suflitae]MCK8602319.1 hypothetical protein [Desulfoferrobacter suflitae]
MLGQILAELPEISLLELGWLVIGLGMVFFGLSFFFYLRRRSAMQQTVRRVTRQFNGVPVRILASRAYFCGMNRLWDRQWKGNGVLLLTGKRLYFRLWERNLDLSIPLKRVRRAEIVYERGPFLLPRRHIRVVYQGMDDHLRTATWHADKPFDWLQMIQETLRENGSHEEATPQEHLSHDENA